MLQLIGMLIALIIICFLLLIFFPTAFGAPFQPSSDKELRNILTLANPKKSDKVADLGSGNGKIVLAFAKKGIEAHGYEINPFLVWWSRQRIKHLGLQKKAFIHHGNMWNADLSKYSIITLFQINYAMPKLKKLLKSKAKRNVQIVSNTWKFPKLKPIKRLGHTMLYKFN